MPRDQPRRHCGRQSIQIDAAGEIARFCLALQRPAKQFQFAVANLKSIKDFHALRIQLRLLSGLVQKALRKAHDKGSIILIVRLPPHRSAGWDNIDVSMHSRAAEISATTSASELCRRTDMDGEQYFVETRQIERTFRIPSQLEGNSLRCFVLPKDSWQYSTRHRSLHLRFEEKVTSTYAPREWSA